MVSQMSKFAKPKSAPLPTAEQIERVISAAPTHDGVQAEAEEMRFTMTLPAAMAAKVDEARKVASLTRLAWIRVAIAEKLARDGG